MLLRKPSDFTFKLGASNPPIWFLTAIFLMYILVYLSKKIIKNSVLLFILFLVVSFVSNFLPGNINEFYNCKSVLVFSCFMIAGIMINRIEIKYQVLKTKNVSVIISSLALLVFGFVISQINSPVCVMSCNVGNIFLCHLSAFFTIIGMIGVCAHIPMNAAYNVITFWGKNSMIVLGTHWPLMVGIRDLLISINPMLNRTVIMLPLVLIMEAFIIFIINKGAKILKKKVFSKSAEK